MDPILIYIRNVLRRAGVFMLLTAAQSIVFWFWFWLNFKDIGILDTGRLIAEAWPFHLNNFVSVVAIACTWMSLGNTSIVFLLIGKWWQKRSDVLHRRGSRFIDNREGA